VYFVEPENRVGRLPFVAKMHKPRLERIAAWHYKMFQDHWMRKHLYEWSRDLYVAVKLGIDDRLPKARYGRPMSLV
jgi:ribosomal protein L32E